MSREPGRQCGVVWTADQVFVLRLVGTSQEQGEGARGKTYSGISLHNIFVRGINLCQTCVLEIARRCLRPDKYRHFLQRRRGSNVDATLVGIFAP